MEQNWLEISVDGVSVNVLRVPYFPQTPTDNYCYICCLKMILAYFRNFFNNEIVRQNTPELDIDKIISVTNTKKLGTREENLIKNLDNEIKSLKFEKIENATFEIIEKNYRRGVPTIVIYNGSYLRNQERGGAHAGVVVGITQDKIILNNPWFGYQFTINKLDFEQAWELEYKKAILIKPIAQKTLRDDIIVRTDTTEN